MAAENNETIEYWPRGSGLPPFKVVVLDRTVINREELLYLRGTFAHLGTPHTGWSGDETIVYRRREENGNWRVFKPIQGSPESFKATHARLVEEGKIIENG